MLHSKLLWTIKFLFVFDMPVQKKCQFEEKMLIVFPVIRLLVTAMLLHINLAPQVRLTCEREKVSIQNVNRIGEISDYYGLSPKRCLYCTSKPAYVYTHAYVYILFKNILKFIYPCQTGFGNTFKQADLELYLYFMTHKRCQTESKESIRICQCSQKRII